MGKKLTNQDVDDKLIGRNVVRIGDYQGDTVKIEWGCLVCGHHWFSKPHEILHGRKTGCIQCSRKKMLQAATSRRLTNYIVDKRLEGRNIKRIDEYINAHIPMHWKCMVCSHVWLVSAGDVIGERKTGCPRCSDKKRTQNNKFRTLTNDIIDSRLRYRNIERIDDYTGAQSDIRWKCLVCEYVWTATPSNVLRKNNPTGCLSCVNRIPITNAIADNKLQGRNIKRLGDCSGAHTKIKWECLVCGYHWCAEPGVVLRKNDPTGCTACANRLQLTNKSVDSRLSNRNIVRIGNYVNASTKIAWRCLTCEHQWFAAPCDVLRKNKPSGCSKCAKVLPLDNQYIDAKLIERKILRIGNCIGARRKIEWKCLLCDRTWMAIPNSVLRKTSPTGCPHCSPHYSKPETRWLDSHNVPNGKNHRQVRGLIPGNKRYKVDGYIPETNTIYEFWGDYWHGNPEVYSGDQINKTNYKTFSELYQKTLLKRQMILDAGFNLIEIWESDFLKLKDKK